MFGSYSINKKEKKQIRLNLTFEDGEINFYACNIKYIEGDINAHYDWRVDVMSDEWHPQNAQEKLKHIPNQLICDVLLNQNLFSGVGNIIKNEVLYRVRVHPESLMGKIPESKIKELIDEARIYSFQFLDWKRKDEFKKQKLERFILVGHSMGGAAAIAYAGAHPERITGLLLSGTPGKASAKESKPIIASLESKSYEKVMEDYMKRLLTNATPQVDSLARQGMHRFSKETNLSIIKAIFKYNPLPALTRYAGPKLIVSTPEENQPNSLAAQMPTVPHKIITGTSHWSQMDKPDEFNKILDDFLKTIYSEK